MKAILIHLSDSHISEMNNAVVSRSAEVAATIRPILQGAEMVFIVWTGDITQAGKATEFDRAEEFLASTRREIEREFAGPVHVVLTPGNHDGEFKPVDPIRQMVIEQLESGAKRPDEPRIIEECVRPMQPYFNFEERMAGKGLTYQHQLWKDYKFQIGSKTLRFSSMNASWMTMPGAGLPHSD